MTAGAARVVETDGAFRLRAITRNPESDKARALAALGADRGVADEVEVTSRKAGSAAEEGVKWTSDGQGEFTVEVQSKAEHGTTVRIKLKEDAGEFLDAVRHAGADPAATSGKNSSRLSAVTPHSPNSLTPGVSMTAPPLSRSSRSNRLPAAPPITSPSPAALNPDIARLEDRSRTARIALAAAAM